MTRDAMFDSGFPESLRNEYTHVISIIAQETDDAFVKVTDAYNSEKEIYSLSDGTRIKFPYRIYCQDDDNAYPQFTDIEKLIYDCIFTRNDDGHIREKHIRNILVTDIPEWCIPYIVRLSSEYVIEIIEIIYDYYVDNDKDMIQRFCKNNPSSINREYSRMRSYWNAYYRWECNDIKDYVGYKLFHKCFLSNTELEKL